MSLLIHASLDYWFEQPTDVLLQIEAAAIPEQVIDAAHIDITPTEHFARVASHDMIGERIWMRVQGQLLVDYRATVRIERVLDNCLNLPLVAPHHCLVRPFSISGLHATAPQISSRPSLQRSSVVPRVERRSSRCVIGSRDTLPMFQV